MSVAQYLAAALAIAPMLTPALPAQGRVRSIIDTVASSDFPGGEVRLQIEMHRGRVIVTRGTGSFVVVDPRQMLSGPALDSTLVLPPFMGKRGRQTTANGIGYVYFADQPVELRVELPANAKALTIDVKDSADVFVDNFAGELEIKSARGKVEAYDVVGPVLVEAGSGSIYATVNHLGPRGAMSLLARRGDVFVGLTMNSSANIDAEARRGQIFSNASLSQALEINPATTFSSSSKLGPSSEPHRSLGRIGRGGVLVRLVTLRGGIMVVHCTYCSESVPHR